METMEAILSRRSIRKYTDQTVPEDLLMEVLKAGMSAPSAGNQQPWHFVIVNDRGILNEIPNVHPHSNMLREAPAAIVVCADLKLEKHQGYWVQDCSAAAQNILLAAHAKGLGAVWLGVYPREDRVRGIKKLLGLPENVIPLCVISMGYPEQKGSKEDRFRAERVHRNRW